jgi:CubicO group peptidase (beta-lactamase class C family)
MLNGGRRGDARILQAETIELMQRKTTRFRTFLKGGDDLPVSGRGLGLVVLRSGWYGIGGSAPGYQCLWRYHPSKRIGFVILSNVNAILAGGENYSSARGEIYRVQDALVSILDPTFPIRSRGAEIAFFGSIVLVWVLTLGSWIRGRRAHKRSNEA